MPWTSISKPTGTPYTTINATGKEQYDQANIAYDDSGIFYDGVNTSAWANVSKPTGNNSVTITVGMATGLITQPTYSVPHYIIIDNWTRITKPT